MRKCLMIFLGYMSFAHLLWCLIVSKLMDCKMTYEIFYDSRHNNWNLGHKHSH